MVKKWAITLSEGFDNILSTNHGYPDKNNFEVVKHNIALNATTSHVSNMWHLPIQLSIM